MTTALSQKIIWLSTGVADNRLEYSLVYATSLIEYANKDKQFAIYLLHLVSNLQPIFRRNFNTRIKTDKKNCEIITPLDIQTAVRRANWLMEALKEKELSGREDTLYVLQEWARNKEKEFPKNIIIGIRIGVIIGFTLGYTKTSRVASLVLNESAKYGEISEITKTSLGAMLSLLEIGLQTANGDSKKLEPDMADWFFGDKEINIYTAKKGVIDEITKELSFSKIPHAIAKNKNNDVLALAISPIIENSNIETLWQVESLG